MPSPVRLIQPQPMSQFDRDKMVLGAADAGRMVVNTTTGELCELNCTRDPAAEAVKSSLQRRLHSELSDLEQGLA